MTTPRFHIVLIEPEIPNNTGNIGRTCLATNTRLHLVGKLGFKMDDAHLKRAGLDYWEFVDWQYHPTWEDWRKQVSQPDRVFYFSKNARKVYYDTPFYLGDWFVFGKETKGLDPKLLNENEPRALYLPMAGATRSLNLSNAVTAVIYEAIRQVDHAKA